MMNYIFKCRAFFKMNDLHSSTSNGHLKNAVLLCAVFFFQMKKQEAADAKIN